MGQRGWQERPGTAPVSHLPPRRDFAAEPSPPMPANMSLADYQEGDGQPAKIVVKRGDEKWETTEKELEKLPATSVPLWKNCSAVGRWK